jgi:hypothetical protein
MAFLWLYIKQGKQDEFTHVGLLFDNLLGLAVIVCSPVTPMKMLINNMAKT